MIQWWGWILIWSGLVIALLAMLALFAWWLFRKAMRVLDDLGELADSTEVFDRVDESELPKQTLAVLADLREVRAREDARRAHRARRRSERHRRRLERARRITSVDASKTRWPADWYR
ncbi:MAG: hypothetical protein BGO97_15170 [Micrococcales bacterium 70-64]|nr:hypothetical protein [Leifsonia sp.]ODU65561.1 MAG: hypothetical protein ABT06_15170 [Leifsonia sp. SCN 70-46]OJX87303.1 MAG: hypothetical protein BGO97_15170 [Micrococcales bacterium 70-64]